MAEFESPWVKARAGKPEKCHYGCGKFATLTEPGTPWKAHKVCAEGGGGGVPLGSWDGVEHKVTEDAPYGCGDVSSPTVQGRQCASAGTALTCQLCRNSPAYWAA